MTESGSVIPDWNTRRWGWLKAVTADADLSANAKVLAAALAVQFADYETGKCFPGNAVLVEAMGVKSEDTVQRAFKVLAERGWLRRTEGRGRGNKAVVIFLLRAQVVKLPIRSARLAEHDAPSGEQGDAKSVRIDAKEKAAKLRVQQTENAADLREKGREIAASRIEPNTNQSSGARTPVRATRPHSNLWAVAYHGSDRLETWNAWLNKRGYPNLQRLNCLSSDAGGTGFEVPFRQPPRPDDWLENRIALDWADWAVEQMEARSNA